MSCFLEQFYTYIVFPGSVSTRVVFSGKIFCLYKVFWISSVLVACFLIQFSIPVAFCNVLSLVPCFLCSQSGEHSAKARRQWEEAMTAVLRDIAASPKQQPPPVVQIVIYESSV
jgi:hypothetical protein